MQASLPRLSMNGGSSDSEEPLAPLSATSTPPIRSRQFKRLPRTSASWKKTAGSSGHTRSGKSGRELHHKAGRRPLRSRDRQHAAQLSGSKRLRSGRRDLAQDQTAAYGGHGSRRITRAAYRIALLSKLDRFPGYHCYTNRCLPNVRCQRLVRLRPTLSMNVDITACQRCANS